MPRRSLGHKLRVHGTLPALFPDPYNPPLNLFVSLQLLNGIILLSQLLVGKEGVDLILATSAH